MEECVNRGVTADWFTSDNATVYSEMLEMFSQGKYIDSLTVANHLAPSTDRMHITAHLQHCVDSCITPSQYKAYIRMLAGERAQRNAAELQAVHEELLDSATPDTIDEVISRIQTGWHALSYSDINAEDYCESGLRKINEWEHPSGTDVRIPWPLKWLNDNLPPMSDELIYLVGRPSAGKTAFAIQIMTTAVQAGYPTYFASLESPLAQIAVRQMAQIAQINPRDLQRQGVLPGVYESARKTMELIKGMAQHVTHAGMTCEQLFSFGRIAKEKGAKLLIVDNMKQIRTPQSITNPLERYIYIAQRLKWMRDDIGLAQLVLHHLGRQDQVSWSDDIERDADIILALKLNEEASTMPSHDNHWTGRWIVDCELRKVRDADAGFAKQFEFDKKVLTFRESEVA